MSRMLSLVVSLMVLLTLGLAQAPRVCVGDGAGGACQPAACACVAACSCQEAHRRAKLATAADAVSDCCVVDAASIGSSDPSEAGACHGPGTWPHFAPQDRHWYATPAVWPDGLRFGHPDFVTPGLTANSAHRATAPPEKPPRVA